MSRDHRVFDVRRLRPEAGAEPERVFGGRELSWVRFAGDAAYALHPSGSGGNRVWLLGRVEPDSDVFDTIAEFPNRPLDPHISDGHFYYWRVGAIARLPLP